MTRHAGNDHGERDGRRPPRRSFPRAAARSVDRLDSCRSLRPTNPSELDHRRCPSRGLGRGGRRPLPAPRARISRPVVVLRPGLARHHDLGQARGRREGELPDRAQVGRVRHRTGESAPGTAVHRGEPRGMARPSGAAASVLVRCLRVRLASRDGLQRHGHRLRRLAIRRAVVAGRCTGTSTRRRPP